MQSNASCHRSGQLDLADLQQRTEPRKKSVTRLLGKLVQVPRKHDLDDLLGLTWKQPAAPAAAPLAPASGSADQALLP
jgi:hypothetical protein